MYLNIQETNTKLETLSTQYSSICERIELPYVTHEGNTSWALRVHAGTSSIRHGVLIISGVHAREWGTVDITMYFIESILAAYAANTGLTFDGKTFTANEIKNALESIDLFVFPLVNPDGKAYSLQVNPSDANEWRKNRRPTNDPNCIGIDLNRNYDLLWDYKTHFHPDSYGPTYWGCYSFLSVSDMPCSTVYHGTSPFSEAETKNVRHLLDSNPHMRFFMDVHGVRNDFLYPWGDDDIQINDPDMNFTNPSYDGLRGLKDHVPPGCQEILGLFDHPEGPSYKEYMHAVDLDRYEAIGTQMNIALSQVRGTTYDVNPSFTGIYGTSGDSKDYAFSRHISNSNLSKIDAFILEFGPSNWPGFYRFQPPYEDPPGVDYMTPVILDVSAVLTALCTLADRVPIISVNPNLLNFGKVKVGSPKTLSSTFQNLGNTSIDIVNIVLEGPDATSYNLNTPSPGTLGAGQSLDINVTYSPTGETVDKARVVITFRKPGESLQDIRVIRLAGLGCEVVPKDACTAPVFEKGHPLVCLLLAITSPFVVLGFIFAIIIVTIFQRLLPPGTLSRIICNFRRYLFRVRHCSKGNTDPCRILRE